MNYKQLIEKCINNVESAIQFFLNSLITFLWNSLIIINLNKKYTAIGLTQVEYGAVEQAIGYLIECVA